MRKITQKYLAVILFVLPIFAFFILNIFTPLIADDFVYSFVYGGNGRVTSIYDILISQYHHYMEWGGRNVAHFFAQFFLFLEDKYVFNICNTVIYCCLILLIQFHVTGSLKKINPFFFFAINGMLWFLVPVWGQNFLWLTGSCNYLWMATIVLSFLVPYRKRNDNHSYKLNIPLSSLFFILGILAGWSAENVSAAVFFLLLAYFISKFVNKEKVCLFEILGCIGFLIGFVLLISAPGNYARLAVIEQIQANQHGFVFTMLMRFVNVTHVFVRNYGLFLLGISVWLGLDIIVYQKKKLNLFTWFYFLAGLASVYSMLLSPGFADRAHLIVTIFFCITALNIAMQLTIEIPGIIKRWLPLLSVMFFIGFSNSFLAAGRDVMGVYLRWKERTQYIVTQKAQGVVDIEVKAPIPAKNKHSALYGLYDMSGDATKWPNTSIAEYFGIHSIKGIDSNEPWKPAWKKK